METFRKWIKLSATVCAAGLVVAGCSKKQDDEPLPPPVPKQAEQKPVPPKPVSQVAPTNSPGGTFGLVKPGAAKPKLPTTPVAAEPEENVPQIEKSYRDTTDFSERVQAIYKLSDLGTPDAIVSLGRLFRTETDNDLKTEILDSLFDIDGQDERKAALLAAGAGTDQPKEVRQSAIDGLVDIDGKFAMPILQALQSDTDPEIRDQAKDSIEQLQVQSAQQK